jgi:hypothetical protein
MATAMTKLSAEDMKMEASKIGLIWSAITGLFIQRFEDGSALVVVAEGDHADARKLVEHLVTSGMAERD